ncbi:MAG TPA: GNAT family N-acetyltransferase [Verrucomicrobiae bacterium]|nr:GNAT family N-acetyltransferase [Verrucomicrobiae bacterium]
MNLRPATPNDITTLHALVEAGYRGDSAKQGWTHEADLLGGQRTDVAALAEMIADPEQTILLAEADDGALLGCVLIADEGERDGQRIAYLGMLTVSPTLQNGGLGRQLIAAAESYARTFGAHVMEMTVIKQRRELIDWYIRRGYADTGREEPFPFDDERFGLPKTRDLVFVVLAKPLA